MRNREDWKAESVVHVIREALTAGARVDVDGLGSFVPDKHGGFQFVSRKQPKVFLAYVTEDSLYADRLYDALVQAGFDPWMDRKKLLPGQNWPRAIEDALSVSDFVVLCFSSRAVRKRGGFQSEIRFALDCGSKIPLDQVFLIPVRLDECRVPARIQRETQYVDLFPSWTAGVKRILRIIRCANGRLAA